MRSLFRARRSASNADMQVGVLDEVTEPAKQEIILGTHRGSQEEIVQVQHARTALSYGWFGLLRYQKSFIVNPSVVFTCTAPVVQVFSNSTIYRISDWTQRGGTRIWNISIQWREWVHFLSCTDLETTTNFSTCPSTYSTGAMAEQLEVPQLGTRTW